MTQTAQTQTPQIVPDNLHDLNIIDPARFPAWRTGQRELAQRILDSPAKIVILEAECGVGKSLIPIAAAMTAGVRAMVMIQTVNLQHQYMRDFSKIAEMASGRSRYSCNITGQRADFAPCTIGVKCPHKGVWDRATGEPLTDPSCYYFAAKAKAQKAPLAVLNYAFWLAESRKSNSFIGRNWIICDEAHELDEICMKAGTAEIIYDDVSTLRLPRPQFKTVPEAMEYAAEHERTVSQLADALIEKMRESGGLDFADAGTDFDDAPDPDADTSLPMVSPTEGDQLRAAIRLGGALSDIAAITDPDEWVVDTSPHSRRNVQPIYGKYGFRRILNAVPQPYTDPDTGVEHPGGKVIMMSAFIAPDLIMRTLDLDPSEVEVIHADSGFDRSRSPVLYCPLFRMSYNTRNNEWQYVADVVKLIADTYPDTPGIVHVPSVTLRDTLYNNTPMLRDRWIAYDGKDAQYARFTDKDTAVAKFMASRNGILLGQSVTTGLDVPYVPGWQIVVKLPYMPTNAPAVAARKAVDKAFYDYYTICQVVQATGRVKRAPDHDGPTIILDANFGWFFPAQKDHFPQWFKSSLRWDGWSWFTSDAQTGPRFKVRLTQAATSNGVLVAVPPSARSAGSGGGPVRPLPAPRARTLRR